MRGRRLLSVLLGGLFGSGAAEAGVLTSLTWTQRVSPGLGVGFTLTRTASQLGGLDFAERSTEAFLSVSLVFPHFTTSFFIPRTANLPITRHLRLTQGGPQDITATPAMGGGTPGIPGTVVVKTAAHVNLGVTQSMLMVGAITLVKVPLSHGRAGTFTTTFNIVGVYGYLTVDFY